MLGSLLRSGPNVRSPGSFFTALHFKLHRFAFFQSVEIKLLKAAAMEKDLLPIRGTNKPKSAVANDPLDCALHTHLDLRRGALRYYCLLSRLLHTLGPLYQHVRSMSKG